MVAVSGQARGDVLHTDRLTGCDLAGHIRAISVSMTVQLPDEYMFIALYQGDVVLRPGAKATPKTASDMPDHPDSFASGFCFGEFLGHELDLSTWVGDIGKKVPILVVAGVRVERDDT